MCSLARIVNTFTMLKLAEISSVNAIWREKIRGERNKGAQMSLSDREKS